MELITSTAAPSGRVALGARTTVLTERALALLGNGPADAVSVVREVCQIPAVMPALADHLAVALLGADSRFTRRLDGWWELATADRSLIIDRSLETMGFAVVDVEATGTSALGGDRIMEVAVVEVKAGQCRVLFDSLINPERPIPSFVTSLTGISWEMVRNAPTFAEIAPQLAGVLEGNIFVAHNAGFDWRFVSTEMLRATGRPLVGTRLCTVRMAKRLLPTLRRRSLDHVSAHYGIINHARHRAGGDAVATAEVLRRLLRLACDLGVETLDELQAHMRGPMTRRKLRRALGMPTSVTDDTTA
jgi:DNA polymerase-3 subunit epsilon